jgi:hypothetical protein
MCFLRKRQYIFLFAVILIFLFCKINLCYSQRGSDRGGLYYRTFADTIKKENPFLTLKINPIQFTFNEIPVSVEIVFNQKSSLQFQVGYIFPSASGSFLRKLFEEIGTGGTTTDMHVLNHLRSPYNSHGLSFKLELRSTGKNLYYAPQFMYKHCYYNDENFLIFSGQVALNKTESKNANIFGFGLMIGRQSYEELLVLDWYGGLGLRINSTTVSDIKITPPVGPSIYWSNEDKFWIYPYLNLGMRVGIKLGRN